MLMNYGCFAVDFPELVRGRRVYRPVTIALLRVGAMDGRYKEQKWHFTVEMWERRAGLTLLFFFS